MLTTLTGITSYAFYPLVALAVGAGAVLLCAPGMVLRSAI